MANPEVLDVLDHGQPTFPVRSITAFLIASA
jgi:hypothetical protein